MNWLREFGQWWLARMAEFVPARLRRRDEETGDALMVELEGDTVGLLVRRGGRETLQDRLGLATLTPAAISALLPRQAPSATLLRVPATMLLEREVTLPAATERDLDRVLGYEMDRFTPFAAGDVYWACGPVTRDRARSRISFRLSVVPKLAIAPVVEALRSAGRAPAALLVAMDGALRRLSLNPEGPVLTRHGPVAVAACACVLLAVVAAALPIVMEARALSALEARIERGRPALAEVEGLRRRIAASTAGADALLGEEARLGCVLCTVALLTDLLPDDAYLTALTLRQRQVTLSGQAGDAARLIPRLSASAAVSEVAFLSPVTRSGQGRGEQFSLRLTMAP